MDSSYDNIADFTLVDLLGDLPPGDVLNLSEKRFEQAREHIRGKRVRTWGGRISELDHLLATYLTKMKERENSTTGGDFVRRFKERPIKPLLSHLSYLGIDVSEPLAKQFKRYILWALEYKSLKPNLIKAESVQPMPNPSPWVYNQW
jgi:hypothetical protein